MVRTQTVLQSQTTECGLAALAMLLAFHGRRVPMRDLRVASGVSRDGTSARALLALAAQYGLAGKGRRCDRIDADSFIFPLIAHCGFDHFVVVEGVRRGRIFLNDPSSGRRDVAAEDFHQNFTGVVLTFERLPGFHSAGSGFSWPAELRQLVAGSEIAVAALLALRLGSAAVVCAFAVLLQYTVDGLSEPAVPSWFHLVMFALAAAVAVGLHTAELQLLSGVAQRLSVKNTLALFEHIKKLPMDFFNYRAPEWIVGVLESKRHVAALICGTHGATFAGVIAFPVLFLAMAHYDRLAAASALACAVAITVAERLQRQRRSSLFCLAHTARSQSDGYSETQLARIESLKLGGRAEETLGSLTGFQALAIEAEQEQNAALARARAARTLALSLSLSGLLALLARNLGAEELTAGGMAAFWVLATAFLHAVTQWAGAGEGAGALRDALMQHEDIASTEPETSVGASHAHASPAADAVLLEARSLSFGYNRAQPPVIDAVSLTLGEGGETGILALPGSGASTLVRLLTGMQEPWNGDVLLQRAPIRALPGRFLAQVLALVTRDGFLFEGTVRDNVCLWDERVSEAALAAALEDACIADVIANRNGGHLHRVAPGGANFSGGERQRLLIARALVRVPRLLILDNALDLLDLSLEAQVRATLRQRGCTTLIVSQRLETIQSCQKIFLLTHGRLSRQA